MARISDITIIAYALVAVAGALWKKELRAGYRWLTAKALALRSEVRAFVAWVFMPDPLEGLTTIDAEDIESIEYNYRGSRDLDISSPDVPQDDPWCTTPGEPTARQAREVHSPGMCQAGNGRRVLR